MKSIVLPVLALAALAGCDGGTPAATATPAAEPTATETAAFTAIPVAIRGRWGLVPADCEPGRDDAKGLLTIDATTLEFYESVGTLDAVTEAGPTRIRAAFDFEGEGMTWQREVMLEVQDGGDTLVRRDYGLDAAPAPYRYTECNQGN